MKWVVTEEVVVNPQEIISANTVLISSLRRMYSFGGLVLYRRIIPITMILEEVGCGLG